MKFCINCKHYESKHIGLFISHIVVNCCNHPLYLKHDPVTGRQLLNRCDLMRESETKCGENANHYEEGEKI